MNTKHLRYNRIYAPFIVGITLIVWVFFAQPTYTKYIDTKTQLFNIQTEHQSKQKELDTLVALQKEFASSSGSAEVIEKVKKLDQKFEADRIMSAVMLNDFTRPSTLWQPRISISSISVDKGSQLPNGLSLGSVWVGVSARTVDDMVDFITHLTQSSEYAFTIDSITLPINTALENEQDFWWISLGLSLGVYYFE